MGLPLAGDVLTLPRPMGPHARTVTFSPLSLLRVPAARSRLGSRDATLRAFRFRQSPVGRAPKTGT